MSEFKGVGLTGVGLTRVDCTSHVAMFALRAESNGATGAGGRMGGGGGGAAGASSFQTEARWELDRTEVPH